MRSVRTLPVVVALAAGSALPARAEDPRTLLILDGSGSMAGRIGGRTKADIARETVTTVLDTLPPERAIGLMAYGHRRKGDCGDIELLVPPAPGNAAAVRKAVARMKFIGKTPLTAAVRQAARDLDAAHGKATVVLVTDGIESCDGDPCALGRDLAASSVGFTAHVVGFGLSAQEGAAVACLATETGGRYFAADNAAGLAAALTATVAAAPEPPAAPAAPVADHFPGAERMPGVALSPTGRTFGPAAPAPAEPAFPADGTADACAALCTADAACGSWQFEPPGSYFIEAPRCRLYGRDAEMDYAFEAPDLPWEAGMKPDVAAFIRLYAGRQDAPRPVAVTLSAADFGADVAVSWSAVPLDGQAADAVAMPDAFTGPWDASLEPGRWTVTGTATDGRTVRAGITVAPEGGSITIPATSAGGDAATDAASAGTDTTPIHDAIAFACDKDTPCRITDPATGLEFLLPKGYGAAPGFYHETAAGIRAEQPTLEIYRLDQADAGPVLVLNPRQWDTPDGQCQDGPAGRFCVRTDGHAETIAAWAGNLSAGLPRLP